MLLNKIRLLKNKIKLFENTLREIKKNSLDNIKKNVELENRIQQLEEYTKTQNCLNESTINQIKTEERERIKLVKDIQIIVATLKDVYSLVVQNNISEYEFFDDDFSKKNKKNNTYH